MDAEGSRQDPPPAPPVVDVVVPVQNEIADLDRSVRRLHRYLRERFPFSARITIADNASTDGTWPAACALAEELGGVRASHIPIRGRGAALATAWLASDAAVVAYTDVDLSTGLDALLPLVAPLVSGHSDVAIGSRLAPGARTIRGTKREIVSRCYNLLLRVVLRVRFRDAQCGFKALRADVARQLVPRTENRNWFFDTELLVLAERAGFRIHEVPVDWVDDPDSRVAIVPTAIEDLRGVARLSRRLLSGEATNGLQGRRGSRTPLAPSAAQLLRFGLVGALSTAAYALLVALLRPAVPLPVANAAALAATAFANTAVNRRFTFGVRGRAGLAADHAGGLVTLAISLVVTTLALAALAAVRPHPTPEVELAVLVTASTTATLARFLLLRALMTDRRRPPAAATEVSRRQP